MSNAGKIRFSASERSSLISQLPVPLNSSKITSSMREPVSTSAVAMMVSDPPPTVSSTLRAEPKKALGLAMGVLQHHLRHVHVALRRLVKAGGDHLTHAPRNGLAHFFRALIHEQDQEH